MRENFNAESGVEVVDERAGVQDPFGDVTPEEADIMLKNIRLEDADGLSPELRKLIESGEATITVG